MNTPDQPTGSSLGSLRVDVALFAYIVGAMAASRGKTVAIVIAIVLAVAATPLLLIGVWKAHTRSVEAAALTEAHSMLPAKAHVVSEQAQSCGSDAGAAHRCVSIVFRLGGSIADQIATFEAQAEDRGWESLSQSQSPGAYSLTFVKPPERIEVTLRDPASAACHPEGSPSGSCANTLARFPYGS